MVGIFVGLVQKMRFDLMNFDLSIATRKKQKRFRNGCRKGISYYRTGKTVLLVNNWEHPISYSTYTKEKTGKGKELQKEKSKKEIELD